MTTAAIVWRSRCRRCDRTRQLNADRVCRECADTPSWRHVSHPRAVVGKIDRNAAMLHERTQHGTSYAQIGQMFGLSKQRAELIVKRERAKMTREAVNGDLRASDVLRPKDTNKGRSGRGDPLHRVETPSVRLW